jgi:hypothetical protein
MTSREDVEDIKPGITMAEYEQALADDAGWCTTCEAFTTYGCEPDAADYDCARCGNPMVKGVESAFMDEDFLVE